MFLELSLWYLPPYRETSLQADEVKKFEWIRCTWKLSDILKPDSSLSTTSIEFENKSYLQRFNISPTPETISFLTLGCRLLHKGTKHWTSVESFCDVEVIQVSVLKVLEIDSFWTFFLIFLSWEVSCLKCSSNSVEYPSFLSPSSLKTNAKLRQNNLIQNWFKEKRYYWLIDIQISKFSQEQLSHELRLTTLWS